MAKMPQMIPVKDAAAIIGVSGTRVREYIHQGRLSADKIGGVFVLNLAEVQAFKRRDAGRPRKDGALKPINGQKPPPPKARDLQETRRVDPPEESA